MARATLSGVFAVHELGEGGRGVGGGWLEGGGEWRQGDASSVMWFTGCLRQGTGHEL